MDNGFKFFHIKLVLQSTSQVINTKCSDWLLIMNKTETLAVMHEILDAWRESVTINSVSLDPSRSHREHEEKGYQIKMQCELDGFSRSIMKPILEKHGLGVKEEGGFVTIYSLAFVAD